MNDLERVEEALAWADDWPGPWYSQVQTLAAALREALDEATKWRRQAGREGIVEVYDWQGVYLGCMGVETWQALALADREDPNTITPAIVLAAALRKARDENERLLGGISSLGWCEWGCDDRARSLLAPADEAKP